MKLELKYLASYLPYSLKGIDEVNNYYSLYSLDSRMHDFDLWIDENFQKFSGLGNIKPILFPLSSLTKEITINGETFIPYDELTEGETVSMSLNDYACDWDERTYYGFEKYVNEWINGDIHHLDFLPFGFIQKLIEWKLDVFGLIEAGLAEPVTEDFNPYK